MIPLEPFKTDFTGPTRPAFFTGKPIQNLGNLYFCTGFPVKNIGLVGPVKSILKGSKGINQSYIMPLHGKKGWRSYFRPFGQKQHTLINSRWLILPFIFILKIIIFPNISIGQKNHQHFPWSDVEDGIQKRTQYISHFLECFIRYNKIDTYYIENTNFTSIRLFLAT